jgi:hypothetical protein
MVVIRNESRAVAQVSAKEPVQDSRRDIKIATVFGGQDGVGRVLDYLEKSGA